MWATKPQTSHLFVIKKTVDSCNWKSEHDWTQEKIYEGLVPRLAIAIFATFPSYWSIVEPARFEEARDFVFKTAGAGFEEEYAGLIEKINNNYKNVTSRKEEIIKACQRLSKTDTGALIIVGSDIPESITNSGIQINAEISADLLETIFFPKTNLHDGAVVIMANKVVCAGCYLPMTQDANLPREFGSRHRAAIGLSESNSDLTVIVVSEETGIISAMHNGKVKRYLDAVQLKLILDSAMGLLDHGAEETIWGID